MKKSELRQIIKEELEQTISEGPKFTEMDYIPDLDKLNDIFLGKFLRLGWDSHPKYELDYIKDRNGNIITILCEYQSDDGFDFYGQYWWDYLGKSKKIRFTARGMGRGEKKFEAKPDTDFNKLVKAGLALVQKVNKNQLP